MTRKDYIRIAKVLKELRLKIDDEDFDTIFDTLSSVFKKDNPSFDRQKFLRACLNSDQ